MIHNGRLTLSGVNIHQHIVAARRVYLVLRAGVEEECCGVLKILLIALKVLLMLISQTSVMEVTPDEPDNAKPALIPYFPC